MGGVGGGTEELNPGGLLRGEALEAEDELTALTGWGKGEMGVSRRAMPFLMTAGAGGGNLVIRAVRGAGA